MINPISIAMGTAVNMTLETTKAVAKQQTTTPKLVSVKEEKTAREQKEMTDEELKEYIDKKYDSSSKWIDAADWVSYNKLYNVPNEQRERKTYRVGNVSSGNAGSGGISGIGFNDETVGVIVGVGVLYMFLSIFRR